MALVVSHSITVNPSGALIRISGTTADTHSPGLVSLYPALHAQAQACTSALLIKWLYFGSLLASHTRHAASDSVPHAPRYSPAGHPDIVHDVQDSPDLQYPSSQVHEQLSVSRGCPDVV